MMAYAVSLQVYQTSWRYTYARIHIDLAIESTDIETALQELMRARFLLTVFPQEGNYDIVYHSPRCELAVSWQAFENIISYAETMENLTDTCQINHGMEELRVRLSNFEDERLCSFGKALNWAYGGVWELPALLFWFLSIVFSVIAFFTRIDSYRSDDTAILSATLLIILIAFAIATLVLGTIPVLYVGAR